LTVEEFFKRKLQQVLIEQFSDEVREIKTMHCHQKNLKFHRATLLNVPKNSTVTIYNWVAGMAGSFGYEKSIMRLVCRWRGHFISKK
jgi:hypothetical protein